VKVLPRHLATDPEALQRFEREAKAVAALSRPNILAIHDFGTNEGTAYAVTERLEGQTLRGRSDIFALGCVLFEMLTGRRAFQRETAAETLTAILREDVPDLAESGAQVRPAFDQLVRHCLEKQPEERFQSARDLAFALQALGGGQPTSGGTPVVEAPTSSPPWRRLLPLAATAALLAGAFVAGRLSTPPQTAAGPAIISFGQVTDLPGVETTPTLSPDGQSMVYAAADTGTLYLLRIGSRRPVPLTTARGGAADSSPAFSPDGERIAFRSERDGGGIFVMTATGESVTRLSDFGFDPSWSPDGTSIVVSPSLFRYPTDVGSDLRGLAVIDVAMGTRRTSPWQTARCSRAGPPADPGSPPGGCAERAASATSGRSQPMARKPTPVAAP
jgi:hypothetical protein